MLAVLAALFLAASLISETAVRGHLTLGRGLAVAGLAFLVLAVLTPYRSRPPEVPVSEQEQPQHPAVTHPGELLAAERRAIGRANEWLATHLAVVFGAVWTVWVFFVWPLLAQFFSPLVEAKTSYYAQSWVQLFALPLFVWVGNRLQRSADAQSDAQHLALTHIATVSDQNKTLIEQNTELTTQVHALVTALSGQPASLASAKRLATPAERAEGSGL